MREGRDDQEQHGPFGTTAQARHGSKPEMAVAQVPHEGLNGQFNVTAHQTRQHQELFGAGSRRTFSLASSLELLVISDLAVGSAATRTVEDL